jgi:hypothetical protein
MNSITIELSPACHADIFGCHDGLIEHYKYSQMCRGIQRKVHDVNEVCLCNLRLSQLGISDADRCLGN